MWRSTVLSLPLQKEFPALAYFVNNKEKFFFLNLYFSSENDRDDKDWRKSISFRFRRSIQTLVEPTQETEFAFFIIENVITLNWRVSSAPN